MLTYGPLIIKGQISNVISLHGMPDLSSFEYSNWPVRFSLWCLHTCLKYIGLSLKASPYSPQPMCLISVKGTSTTLRPWYGLDQNPAGPSQEFGLQWQWNVKNSQGFEHVMASDRSDFNSVKNGLPG